MEIKKGFLYFVSDDFFEKANDPFLKKDHETTKKPHYFAFQDKIPPLIWIVPCSSKIEKYEKIVAAKQAAGKPTDIIKIVKIQDKKEALLFQDMFPILPQYLSYAYIRGEQPVYIADPNILLSLEKNSTKIIGLIRRGIKFTPTQPNALHIEKLMLSEYQAEKTELATPEKETAKAAPAKADWRAAGRSESTQQQKQEKERGDI